MDLSDDKSTLTLAPDAKSAISQRRSGSSRKGRRVACRTSARLKPISRRHSSLKDASTARSLRTCCQRANCFVALAASSTGLLTALLNRFNTTYVELLLSSMKAILEVEAAVLYSRGAGTSQRL
jgi:hypothetical protein